MTDSTFLQHIRPHGRFARSVNVERDAASDTIESYLPTGRALDVVRRAARALVEPGATRAFSVTGPYGSGKSSLAVFLDGLLAPFVDPAYVAATATLSRTDSETARLLVSGRARLGAHQSGFVRGVVTAAREPVAATVLRAVTAGVIRQAAHAPTSNLVRVAGHLKKEVKALDDRRSALPPARFILDVLGEIGSYAPVLLLIDEFGKNLEAFADARGEADLFLLQSLAEAAHDGERGLPLILVTMQHLAFEDYIDLGSVQQRREWAKIQGRFEDIPYVDTPLQTRNLISAVWDRDDAALGSALDSWAVAQEEGLRQAGLIGAVEQEVDLRRWWPLHPSTMLVLPELCARYGQNERTLFSFLASTEPLAVPAWLSGHQVATPPPDVRLDRVYDYFVDSASTLISASQSAARWLEVETSIRDAVGLDSVQRRVLKVVGLLNLVSAGGSLRASRDVLVWALLDQQTGTDSVHDILRALAALEGQGRITWRDFADEFRIWRGTDVDIKGELDLARRRARDLPAASLLSAALPLGAVVAGQSTIASGTVRAFRRSWADDETEAVTPAAWADPEAGTLLYVLGGCLPAVVHEALAAKPVVMAPVKAGALISSAVEVVAIRELLRSNPLVEGDVVARRELIEREAEATVQLEADFRMALDGAMASEWHVVFEDGTPRSFMPGRNVSSALSSIVAEAYPQSPPVRNELLNRHDLSSQGAKARRELVEALVTRWHDERFALDGFGPERAIYEAVFHATGIHVPSAAGRWTIAPPKPESGWLPAWNFVQRTIHGSKSQRLGLDYLLESLQAPPFGMTAGAAPVLVLAVLVHAQGEVAVYEHGTYKPRLAPDLCERLLRNPSHFQLKHFGADRGQRLRFLELLGQELALPAGEPSVLRVVRHLVTLVNGLPAYTRATTQLSERTRAVRDVIVRATEPDLLLFDALPALLHGKPIRAGRVRVPEEQLANIAGGLRRAVDELSLSYSELLAAIVSGVREACAAPDSDLRTVLAVRAAQVEGQILDPKVRAFLASLRTSELPDQEWAEYVGMVVVGPPPATWTDADELRFKTSVSELGGTFRRLEALYFDRRADGGKGFDAVRITLTRPDGSEHARVVTLEPAQRAGLSRLAEDALDSVAAVLGSTSQAREALLAFLAEELMCVPPGVTAVPYEGGSDGRNGTDG